MTGKLKQRPADVPAGWAWCTRCELVQLAEEYSVDLRNRSGLASWCRSCTREANKRNRAGQTEAARQARERERIEAANLKEIKRQRALHEIQQGIRLAEIAAKARANARR